MYNVIIICIMFQPLEQKLINDCHWNSFPNIYSVFVCDACEMCNFGNLYVCVVCV